MDAICIANKHTEILFFSRFDHSLQRNIFDEFLSKLTSSAGSAPPFLEIEDREFFYIFQDDLYWCNCIKKKKFLSECGPLFAVENLSNFSKLCAALIGTLTQHSITANAVLLQEIVIETMCQGYMHMENVDKVRPRILSRILSPRESSFQSLSPGLFGIKKTAPTTASHQSLLALETKKKEVFVDVVEKVWATVSVEGTLLRAEVSGLVVLHCFLLHSPILYLSFNTDFATSPTDGFNPTVQFSEVEFGPAVDRTHLDSRREVRVVATPGESLLVRYSLPPSLPHVLPFSLVAARKQLTPSDVELKLRLTSTTAMGTVAPKVVVKLTAPSSTTTIMSRTNGPRDQTVSFSTSDKLITWTITDFPGASYAQSFIRLVDAGEDGIGENASLEFEVSKWVSSGLKVDRVRLEPRTLKTEKWVRYLTTSDTVTFRFS